MIPQPTEFPEWAMQDILDPISGQYNVVEPPSEKKLEGWAFGEKPNRQFWNWFQRQSTLWIEFLAQQEALTKVTDKNGINLFTIDGSQIEIKAIDLDNPTFYLTGLGYKKAGFAPYFVVTNKIGLDLGTPTISGNQPIINGSTNVIVTGITRVIS